MPTDVSEKPVFIFDGACTLCRGRVERWRTVIGDRVAFVSYQELDRLPAGVSMSELELYAHLIDAEGRVFRGAAAVLRVLAVGMHRKWPWWCYEHVPPARWLCDLIYRWVAGNRHRISRHLSP